MKKPIKAIPSFFVQYVRIFILFMFLSVEEKRSEFFFASFGGDRSERDFVVII